MLAPPPRGNPGSATDLKGYNTDITFNIITPYAISQCNLILHHYLITESQTEHFRRVIDKATCPFKQRSGLPSTVMENDYKHDPLNHGITS